MEDGPQGLTLPPPTLEPISRPSSTSTAASLPQLPGISQIASGTSDTHSPRLRTTLTPVRTFSGSLPAAPTPTSVAGSSSLPTCQNCQTSTTPLWRRDSEGSVLCNACGLFLKLHGRPRPISLKTDVIKSRNRVKAMRPDLASKKKAQQLAAAAEANGSELLAQSSAQRRTSQKSVNGHGDGTGSPVSRTGTPSAYPPQGLPGYSEMDDRFQSSTLPPFNMPGSEPARSASPLNGERLLDPPPTEEQLVAINSTLKTRVAELEFVNELYRGRLTQLENEAATTRGPEGAQAEGELQSQLDAATREISDLKRDLGTQLDESHRRENNLKRRLDEMELELKAAKEEAQRLATTDADAERPAKRAKVEPETVVGAKEPAPQPAAA